MGAIFVDFGGRQADCQTFSGKNELRATDSAAYTDAGFGDSFTGEADQVERGKTFGEIALDVDDLADVAGSDDGL